VIKEISTAQKLQQAMALYQAGGFDGSVALCRDLLKIDPHQADALHLLGILLAQRGELDQGIQLLQRAVELCPASGEARSNLANALRSAGRAAEAAEAARRAVQFAPRNAIAYNNLGAALGDMGLTGEAIAAHTRAAELNPDYAEAFTNLAGALLQAGLPTEALTAANRALELEDTRRVGVPAHHLHVAQAHRHRGDALKALGRLEEATAAYRELIEIDRGDVDAMNRLGLCFLERAELDAAIDIFRRAAHLAPDIAEIHNNLGNALKHKGRGQEAAAAYRRAININPRFAEAHNNLGVALHDLSQLPAAHESFLAAIRLRPDYADALANFGNLLAERGQLDDAISVLRHAIKFRPDLADAHSNLANALKATGRLDEALAAYETAANLQPARSHLHSNLVYASLFHPAYTQDAIAQNLREFNRRHGRTGHQIEHGNDPAPNRPLRIGYISPNFRDHVIGRNLLPLLWNHDHSRFEIFCYARLNRRDELTPQFESACDQWRDITGMSDAAVARQIADDKIDILVDLAMHLSDNVLPILALKPAPVQITFAAYPGSTGLDAIDFRLSDPFLDSEESAAKYSEKTLLLPKSFWCYWSPEEEEVGELPALAAGGVTFGCLNEFCKINTPTLELWAGVMRKVNASRLLLLAPEGEPRRCVLETLEAAGIAATRVTFVARQTRRDYLRLYHLIDIGLDTLPYNGHTTSMDSMWMGVPVVTRLGHTVVGRAGWSQLSNLGLTELAAHTDEQFIEIASNLARDVPRLQALRGGLRQGMQRSPLMDAPGFARGVEAAYRIAWNRWRLENQPDQPRVEVQIGDFARNRAAKAA
jgi:predicted O-linked N-acetylglucosamine transferase (SPINDLY family)